MSWKQKDHYSKKAKDENFRARSVYKLQEIDEKYRLLKQGYRVLELGSSPGSWSQYALPKVGKSGLIRGVDRLPMAGLGVESFSFILGDLEDALVQQELAKVAPYHLVMSDMAPNTSGTQFIDQARSLDLCELAASLASQYLMTGGNFLCKLFYGADSQAFIKQLKTCYQAVHIIKPKATRKESVELYILALSFSPSV